MFSALTLYHDKIQTKEQTKNNIHNLERVSLFELILNLKISIYIMYRLVKILQTSCFVAFD